MVYSYLLALLVLLLILLVAGYFLKRWANGPLNPVKKDLTGKLAIITGSSDGIGLITAKDLLKSNAKVIFACRNEAKTMEIINKFPEKYRKNSVYLHLDLESFKSIENFAKEIKSKYPKIDILINNAGISSLCNAHQTEDGHMNIYQVNYLGNVLLTLLLLDHFNETESKIINVSSMAHKRSKLTYGDSKYLNDYDLMYKKYLDTPNKHEYYIDTKLLVVYFTQYLAHVAEEKYPYLRVVCLHPGVIITKIYKLHKFVADLVFMLIIKNILYLFTKDIIHGAQTTLFLSYSDNKDLVNGAYYNTLDVEEYTPKAKDKKLRDEFINETLYILRKNYEEIKYLPLSK